MTTERFFGGVEERIDYLQKTLEWVAGNQPSEDQLTTWITEYTPADSESTVTRNIRFLETIEVLEITSEGFQPTNKGDAFWRHEEPLAIYEGLADSVDGFRTILRAIAADKRTVKEIQNELHREFPKYELPEGVVTKHLDWLKSLALVTLHDGEYSIPIEGGEFKVGKTYSRWFIHDVLKGERYKGIATPSDYPLVLLFTGDSGSAYGYEDEFLGDDTFLYTGEGTEGDMTMDDGNRAIRDHKQNKESLHLFESSDLPWIVTYLGEYEHLEVRELELEDENGDLRNAFRFHLAPIGGSEIEIEGGSPASLSDEELFQKAKQSAPTSSTSADSSGGGRSYPRSQYVREFALRMAHGVCQGCEEEAPFYNKQNQPFLEVHHLTRQSDGGPDDPENVIAVCPNCHREVHEGKEGDKLNNELKAKARNRNKQYL